MKLLYSSLWTIMLVLLAMACIRQTAPSKELAAVDSLLASHPDSAYSLLCRLDSSALVSERDSVLFHLLRAEARYKNFFDDTVDADVASAARFFEKSGDRRNLMRALYYRAVILRNKGDHGNAMIYLRHAIENADTASRADIFYLAKIYQALSEAANSIANGPLHLEYARKSWELYKSLDSLEFIQDSQLWYASALTENKRIDEGISLMREVYSQAIADKDTFMITMSASYLGNAYLWKKDFHNARIAYAEYSKLKKAKNIRLRELKFYLWAMVEDAASEDSIKPLADFIANKYGANAVSHEYYVSRNDFRRAYYSLRVEHDSVSKWYLDNNYNNANYLLKNRQDEELVEADLEIKLANTTKIWIVVTAVLLIIIIVLAAWFIIYSKSKKIQDLVRTVGILSKSIDEISDTPPCLQADDAAPASDTPKETPSSSSSELLRMVFVRLDSLYSAYFKTSEPENGKKQLVSRMEKELESLRDSREFLQMLEEEINAETNGMLNEVYGSLPRPLLEKQRRLAAYLYFNLSFDTICLLLKVEANALYKRRSRLYETLRASTSPRTDEFIAILSSHK